MTAVAEDLTARAFSPFGRVVGRPESDPDARGPGWSWWGEIESLGTDGRRWTFGYLELAPAPFQIDWAEYHLRSPEVIVATTTDILVYVAPPTPSPEGGAGAPDPASFRVFRVPAGQGVVLEPGVWHGAPFSVGGVGSALVLLRAGTGRDDVTIVRFPDTPVQIEVAGG